MSSYCFLKNFACIISNHYKSHSGWWNYLHLTGKTQHIEQIQGDVLMPSRAHLSKRHCSRLVEAAKLAVVPNFLPLTLTFSLWVCVNSTSSLGLAHFSVSTFTSLIQICMVFWVCLLPLQMSSPLSVRAVFTKHKPPTVLDCLRFFKDSPFPAHPFCPILSGFLLTHLPLHPPSTLWSMPPCSLPALVSPASSTLHPPSPRSVPLIL